MKYEIEGLGQDKTIGCISIENSYIDVKYKSLRHEKLDNTPENINYLSYNKAKNNMGINYQNNWDDVIDSYKIHNGYIKVQYLDNSVDMIENTEENLENIKKLMHIQAIQYVKDYEKKVNHLNTELEKTPIVIFRTLLFAVFCFLVSFNESGLINSFAFITNILLRFLSSVFIVLSAINVNYYYKNKKKLEYINKYNLFLKEYDIKIKKFNECYEKEKALKSSIQYINNVPSIDIINLDKITLKELKEAIVKAERYSQLTNKNNGEKLEEEKIKVKTLTNRY